MGPGTWLHLNGRSDVNHRSEQQEQSDEESQAKVDALYAEAIHEWIHEASKPR